MSRRTLVIASALSLATVFGAVASARQVRIINGQVAPAAGGRLTATFQSLVASTSDVAWIGYTVPVKDRDQMMCCWSNGSGSFSGSMAAGSAPCCGSCRIEPATSGTRVPETTGTRVPETTGTRVPETTGTRPETTGTRVPARAGPERLPRRQPGP